MYTACDIRSAYNLVQVANDDVWKTAFRTRWGLFETLVMPFELTNAPATFQHFINHVLRPFLEIFCTAYLDDILIYSDNIAEHNVHVNQALQALQEAGLYLKLEKCELHTTTVQYLGLVITPEGMSMDATKVKVVMELVTLVNISDVRAFLRFANFYRSLILGYSSIVAPLTKLNDNNVLFMWTANCESALQ